ncbi:MAG: hypothetical protein HZB51_32120 [Chloroflexi bacterium]|nr:hypothetical protein [Chloroflexota bacterium]
MEIEISNIVTELESIRSLHDVENLKKLEATLKRLGATEHRDQAMDALYRLYERFPLDDGYGLCWEILHQLERMPNYEIALVQSLQRQPAQFSLTMLERWLNAGRTHIDGIDLIALLITIAANPNENAAIRESAQECLDSRG